MPGKSTAINIALSFFVFILLCCLAELACLLVNRAEGVRLPYIYNAKAKISLQWRLPDAILRGLDPLLGFSYSDEEATQANFSLKTVYKNGFAFYNTEGDPANLDPARLARPLIVALGGSTTMFGMNAFSWPEEMARRMAAEGLPGTMINGGISGYNSSQELLKLQRDVLELKPDLVISYHGYNEIMWSMLPHPMKNLYLSHVLENILAAAGKYPFFPNVLYLFKQRLRGEIDLTQMVEGWPTDQSYARYLVRNVHLMNAITKATGIEHISILQPLITTGEYAERLRRHYPDLFEFPVTFERHIPMYEELMAIKARGELPMYDFTGVYDIYKEENGVLYKAYTDACHVTDEANMLLGGKIFELVRASGKIWKADQELRPHTPGAD